MPTVGLLTNEHNPAALAAAERLGDWLRGRDIQVLARGPVADVLHPTGVCVPASDGEIAGADFVVVFGGDGTLLAAARLLAPTATPMLGIHLGHFGFITEVAPDKLFSAVDDALAGRSQTEARLMLRGVVTRASGDETDELIAMNDIVMASSAVRMTHIRTEIGGQILATYAADGVVVASPTGSTGYSLSAGGPLVHPQAPVMVVTPICPHTLSARTLVVPDTETVRLTVIGPDRGNVVASVDGQIEVPLRTGDSVTITRSPHRVHLLTVGGPTFYEKIRSRWHFGERAFS